jgi:hypothetical protein
VILPAAEFSFLTVQSNFSLMQWTGKIMRLNSLIRSDSVDPILVLVLVLVLLLVLLLVLALVLPVLVAFQRRHLVPRQLDFSLSHIILLSLALNVITLLC